MANNTKTEKVGNALGLLALLGLPALIGLAVYISSRRPAPR